MMTSLRSTLFTTLLLSCITATFAEDDASEYQIELLVFENLNSGDHSSDLWNNRHGVPDIAKAQELTTSSTSTSSEESPFVLLPSSAFQLDGAAQQLGHSASYRVLQHIAWRQPVSGDSGAIPVRIYSGRNSTEKSRQVFASKSSDAILSTNDTALNRNTRSVQTPLDGTVTVTVNRFLRLEINLLFIPNQGGQPVTLSAVQQPDDEPIVIRERQRAPEGIDEKRQVAADEPAIYRIATSRRMRSREVHYFDHPEFGVLAVITPYKLQ